MHVNAKTLSIICHCVALCLITTLTTFHELHTLIHIVWMNTKVEFDPESVMLSLLTFYSFCRFYRNYVFNLNGMEVIIQQKFPQV